MNIVKTNLGNLVGPDGLRYRAVRDFGQTQQEAVAEAVAAGYVHSPRPPLERMKLKQAMLIQSEAMAAENGSFTVGQYTLTADADTRTTFINAKMRSDADAGYVEEDYLGPDGSFYDLNKTQINAVYNAMVAHIKAVRLARRQKIAAIQAASTKEEIEAITW